MCDEADCEMVAALYGFVFLFKSVTVNFSEILGPLSSFMCITSTCFYMNVQPILDYVFYTNFSNKLILKFAILYHIL